jgi:hypothetical protein
MLNTWKSAVNVLKRVMDTVTPIAGVSSISFLLILRRANFRIATEPLCKSSMESALNDSPGACLLPCLLRKYGTFTPFLSFTFQTLLQLIQRDENVETPLEAIPDVFEFVNEATL